MIQIFLDLFINFSHINSWFMRPQFTRVSATLSYGSPRIIKPHSSSPLPYTSPLALNIYIYIFISIYICYIPLFFFIHLYPISSWCFLLLPRATAPLPPNNHRFCSALCRATRKWRGERTERKERRCITGYVFIPRVCHAAYYYEPCEND